MSAPSDTNVLILAGQRSGTIDPLAAEAGVSHKCLVPMMGQSLIGHVARTLEVALPGAPIYVSIEDPGALDGEPTIARLVREGRLRVINAERNLVDSVRAASEFSGFPLLITTGDHPLLTADAVQKLVDEGRKGMSDAVLVMASKNNIEAAHPAGKGRYYEFRDGAFSNCNMFWLKNSSALAAAEAFRGGGQFLKVAGRMLRAFGPRIAILYRLKLLTLEQAFRSISRRLGVKVSTLVLDDGRLAIDVDNASSRAIVEELLGNHRLP